jgi:hypothetical protein
MAVCAACATVLPFIASAQTNYYGTNGTEYAIVGSLPGDQMFPDAALSTNGGFVVWQDYFTDGDGWGISARRLDGTLSGSLSPFRVNVSGAGNQENPRVAKLKNGGAVFVWQGGKQGMQHIYARFMTPTNTWLTSTDLPVSTFTNNFQINPAVTVLNNSNVVVVWSSYNQAGSNSMQDVYAKILSPAGVTISNQFRINQFTNYNQRTPAVAALKNGGFVTAWISEQQRVLSPILGTNTIVSSGSQVVPSVDLYARLYASNGIPKTSEFIVNKDSNPCANPAVAAGSDGGFILTWGAHDMANQENGWDIKARSFSSAGVGGAVAPVNSHLYGDQFGPHISSLGLNYLVVWTSLAQDGSREGVFGQFLYADASPVGDEIQINTTTAGQQMQPVVAADGGNQFAVVWTSFMGSPNNFDLFAQRFIDVSAVLQPMSAPFVYAPFTLSNNVYQPQLAISWPPLLGIAVSNYAVYVDGSAAPAALLTSNCWIMTAADNLTASSTHSFQVGYVRVDGQVSPPSDATMGTTWSGANYHGIPFEWIEAYYGQNFSDWPADVNAALVPGGPSLMKVFMSGGNPLDSGTWLRTALVKTQQGMFLNWNTQAGFTYQVQVTTNMVSWSNLGAPRFAAGASDSIYVGTGSSAYYRVYLVR